VTSEVDFDTLRKEAFASTLATALQNGATALGLHTGAEAKLLFARALAGLVSTFHNCRKLDRKSSQREEICQAVVLTTSNFLLSIEGKSL
jgi:hypothetical protein